MGEVPTKQEISKSIAIYLGRENYSYIRRLTEDDLALYSKLKINTSTSYLVQGDEENLKKFKAYFLAQCTFERYSYASFMMKEYASSLMSSNDDVSFLSSSERELLFLYNHKNSAGSGNTESWILSTVLDRIANRNRKGMVTVVLSERKIPTFEKCSELTLISLSGASKAQPVIQKTQQNNGWLSSSGETKNLLNTHITTETRDWKVKEDVD